MQKKHPQTKRAAFMKITMITIIFVSLSLGSFSVLAADGSLSSILNDWFSKKEEEAIIEIDETISKAQEEQTERLKATLHEVLAKQKEELAEFMDTEKQKRTDALEEYADELMEEFQLEQSNDGERYVQEIEEIMKNAKEQMDTVAKKTENNNDDKSSNSNTEVDDKKETTQGEDDEGNKSK